MTATGELETRLAAHVVAPHRFDAATIDRARLLLLDALAITAAGSTRDSALAAARSVRPTADGARIEGTEARAGEQDAALVNGVAGHGLEIDDTHEASSSHPGVAIWPALVAVADAAADLPAAEGGGAVTLRALLEAGIVGYDVMCAVGVLVGPAESYARGFHPTGVAGILGAAAAVSRLLGLDEAQAGSALAIAANTASGSLEFLADGSWTKRLNAGAAASGGVRAARLAEAGFLAPATWLTGRDGWLRLYGAGLPADRDLTLELGRGVASTSIKLYPCCRYMHGVMDLLIDLHHELPGLRADEVDAIEVAVIEAGQGLVSVPPPRKLVIGTSVDAQFSMPFGAALALTTGAAPLARFDDAPAVAAGLADWMPKVVSVVHPRVEAAYPASWVAAVALRLADGRVIERYQEAYRGSPAAPADWHDVVAKGEGLIGPAARDLADALAGTDPAGDGRLFSSIRRPVIDTHAEETP